MSSSTLVLRTPQSTELILPNHSYCLGIGDRPGRQSLGRTIAQRGKGEKIDAGLWLPQTGYRSTRWPTRLCWNKLSFRVEARQLPWKSGAQTGRKKQNERRQGAP
jgi:hypothetical protein